MKESESGTELHDHISLSDGEDEESRKDVEDDPEANKKSGGVLRNMNIIGTLSLYWRQTASSFDRFYSRSGIHLSAIIAGVVALLLLLILIIVAATKSVPVEICYLDGCVDEGSRLAEVMDKAASPCKDFYQFACGKFNAKKASNQFAIYSIFDSLVEKNHVRLEHMMLTLSSNYPSSALRKLSKFYNNCIREVEGDSSLSKLMLLIQKLGGWDLFNNFNSSKWNFNSQLNEMAEVNSISHVFSFRYYHKANVIVLYKPDYILGKFYEIGYSGLGKKTLLHFYSRYVADLMDEMRQSLTNNSTNQTCGLKCEPSWIAQRILNLDSSIADIWDAGKQDASQIITQAELHAHAPSVEWRRILRAKLGSTAINRNAVVFVPGIHLLESLENLVKTTSASDWNNYMMWTLISFPMIGASDVLASKYTRLQAVLSNHGLRYFSRDRICYRMTTEYLPLAMRALVYHALIGKDNVKQAAVFFDEIYKLAESTLDWMPEKLYEEANRMLSTLHVDFGTVDVIEVLSRLDYHYHEITIGDSLFDNLASLNKFHSKEMRMAADNAGTRSSDDFLDYLVDDPFRVWIYYYRYSNTIHVPPSTLQIPVYNRDLPYYVNAATMGSRVLPIVLHLLYYSTNRTVWDSASLNRMRQYQSCLANNFKDYKLDGEKTIGSEKSDDDELGILRYSIGNILKDHLTFSVLEKVQIDQQILPGEHVSSPEQQLYLAYAQSKCETVNSGQKKSVLSFRFPYREMVNNFVYNSPQFMDAYQCYDAPEEHKGTQCVL